MSAETANLKGGNLKPGGGGADEGLWWEDEDEETWLETLTARC